MAIGEEVLYLTVRELGERMRAHQLSPVELTRPISSVARNMAAA